MAAIALAFAASSQADELVDPTRPVNLAPATVSQDLEQSPALKLETVVVSPYRRVAIINGNTLRQGDSIAGAILEEIGKDSVTLRRNGDAVILSISPAAVVKTRP